MTPSCVKRQRPANRGGKPSVSHERPAPGVPRAFLRRDAVFPATREKLASVDDRFRSLDRLGAHDRVGDIALAAGSKPPRTPPPPTRRVFRGTKFSERSRRAAEGWLTERHVSPSGAQASSHVKSGHAEGDEAVSANHRGTAVGAAPRRHHVGCGCAECHWPHRRTDAQLSWPVRDAMS